MKAILGRCLLCLSSLSGAGTAPPPVGTAVIQGLGQHVAADGRYYSTVAPFSTRSSWPGSEVPDEQRGTHDRFEPPDKLRYVDIEATVNTKRVTPAQAQAAMHRLMVEQGIAPVSAEYLVVAGQKAPLYSFTTQLGGAFAVLVFVAAQRVWLLGLSGTWSTQRADLHEFRHIAMTFRLEPRYNGAASSPYLNRAPGADRLSVAPEGRSHKPARGARGRWLLQGSR